MFNPNQEPSVEEQVVASTVQGLRQLEQLLGYEFEETIDHIQRLYRIKQARNAAKDYALASGRGEARRIVELNKPMSDEEFISRYSGRQAVDKAKSQVKAIYGEVQS